MPWASYTSGILATLWFLHPCASNELTLEGSYSHVDHLDQSKAIALSGYGPYAYVPINFGLTVVDISRANNMFKVSFRPNIKLDSEVRGIVIEGRYAYVSATELVIVDVLDIAAPSMLGSSDLGASVWDIALSGQYAYAVCSSTNSMKVVDVSDPRNPFAVTQVQSVVQLGGARGIAISGQHAYIAAFSNDALTVVDISSTTGAPPLVNSLASSSQLGGASKVAVSGGYAFVLASGINAVTSIDISDPANPFIASSLSSATDLNAPSRIIFAQSRYAYVLTSVGLARVDTLNPQSLSVDTTIALTDGPYIDFEIKTNTAYCLKAGKVTAVGIYVTTTTTTMTQTSSTTTTSTFTSTSTTTSSSSTTTTTPDPRDCASHECPEGMTHKMTFGTPKYCLRPICDMSLDADWCCDQLCHTFVCSGGSTHKENAEEIKCAGFCDPFIDRKLCCKYLPVINESVVLLRSSVSSRVHEVDQLVAMGVPTTARSGGGSTALHFAALHGHREIVEAVIQGRADVNAADEKGWVPLHVAAGRGHLAAVDLLIHNRAIPDLRTVEGKTAREIALQVAGPPGSPDRLQADAAMALSKHERAYKNEMTIRYERAYRDDKTTAASPVKSLEL